MSVSLRSTSSIGKTLAEACRKPEDAVVAEVAGSVASGSVAALAARLAGDAADPGERAACAKSHDLTAGLTKDSAKLRSASRWLRV